MFNDFYNIYKGARDSSWKFLIDHKVDKLPVDLNKICESMDIKLRISKNFLSEEHGATITNGHTTYILLKRDTIPVMRYTTAHELGHIVLGHTLKATKAGYTFATESEQEYQAERFAIDILAPACVLWGLNLHTTKDISEVCNISMTSAQKRAERMEVLYRRNVFLSHPLECQVFRQFEQFISR
ncbi:MAG: ImmA/IrrE family metallo-endopeptidase [Ruminococcus flavefaciens]|nr:ImmA/IrrE family metallo-endopeptidase [Ruminococcus flavefaciens]